MLTKRNLYNFDHGFNLFRTSWFNGLDSYYSRFIKGFTELESPMTTLTKKVECSSGITLVRQCLELCKKTSNWTGPGVNICVVILRPVIGLCVNIQLGIVCHR